MFVSLLGLGFGADTKTPHPLTLNSLIVVCYNVLGSIILGTWGFAILRGMIRTPYWRVQGCCSSACKGM